MQTDKVICIVEDKEELRNAMAIMVSSHQGLIHGGSFANAEEAVPAISSILPDAVLMDINLPGSSGISCVAALKSRFPNMFFLMCTAYEDNEKIFSSLKAGASGYILKSEGPGKILAALDEMLNGGSPMSASIARKVVNSFSAFSAKDQLIQELTDREREILNLIATGLMNKEVAAKLFISTATVKTHIQHIYEKLQVNTRVEAVNLYLNR